MLYLALNNGGESLITLIYPGFFAARPRGILFSGLYNPRRMFHKLALQHGCFIPFTVKCQLMTPAGKGVARQLSGLHAKQTLAGCIAQLSNQSMMEFAHGVQIAPIVTV